MQMEERQKNFVQAFIDACKENIHPSKYSEVLDKIKNELNNDTKTRLEEVRKEYERLQKALIEEL